MGCSDPYYEPEETRESRCKRGDHCNHSIRVDNYGDKRDEMEICCYCGKTITVTYVKAPTYGHGKYGPKSWRRI